MGRLHEFNWISEYIQSVESVPSSWGWHYIPNAVVSILGLFIIDLVGNGRIGGGIYL